MVLCAEKLAHPDIIATCNGFAMGAYWVHVLLNFLSNNCQAIFSTQYYQVLKVF